MTLKLKLMWVRLNGGSEGGTGQYGFQNSIKQGFPHGGVHRYCYRCLYSYSEYSTVSVVEEACTQTVGAEVYQGQYTPYVGIAQTQYMIIPKKFSKTVNL